MLNLGKNLRYALRTLSKSPGATITALLTLGLGIGANTAVYSCAYGMLQHPLNFPDFQQLTVVSETANQNPSDLNPLAPANFNDWRSSQHAFSQLTQWEWYQGTLTGDGPPQYVQGGLVDANFFHTLGIKPVLGRTFLPEETAPGHDRELLLSYDLWQKRFASNPAVLGQTIELDSKAYTIVGVMGADSIMPAPAQMWVPLALDDATRTSRTNHTLHVWGRLNDGVSMVAARAELAGYYQHLAAQYPASNRGWGVNLRSLADWLNGNQTSGYIYMLLATVAFVLLIACANVANLQFARALGRGHELAIRSALGASRRQIVGQLLLESLLMAAGGSLVGLATGWYSIRLIQAYMPARIASLIGGWDHVKLSFPVFLFTLGVALAAGLVAGLAPAWSASRPNLVGHLREGARGASSGRKRQKIRAALVVAQMALATVLLVCAGLMVRGFSAVALTSAKFDPASVLDVQVNLPAVDSYLAPEARTAFYDRVLDRSRALPGVQSAALAASLPLVGNNDNGPFSIEGRAANPDHPNQALLQQVSAEYFSLTGIPILEGRPFSASDSLASQPVAVISRQLAHVYWPAGDAIGHRIKFGGAATTVTDAQGRRFNDPWLTIVGIAGDVPYDPSSRLPTPVLYRASAQAPQTGSLLLLRGPGDPVRWTSAVRGIVAEADPNQAIYSADTWATQIHEQNIGITYVATMMAVAGGLALLLAAVGVYALMLHAVNERKYEFGVRMTLGARPGQVAGLILGRGGLLLALGIVIGLPLAFLASRPLASLSYGISPSDPITYAVSAGLLIAAALCACLGPALRAGRVDPLLALRAD